MTTISAKVIQHSVAKDTPPIASMLLRYPRCIHSEFMTHRQFSRNASSSRAIPVERLIADIKRDPFVPLHWGKNQKGMQAFEECNEPVQMIDPVTGEGWTMERDEAWLSQLDQAILLAEGYVRAGYHKQIVNRLLEPWAHINVLVTSTEWTNFFGLREHRDAEPHIQVLASVMKKALADSEPQWLERGDWHLPFISEEEVGTLPLGTRLMASVARCARTSYLTYDGEAPLIGQDIDLYNKLITSAPVHASPTEHQACSVPTSTLNGNFAPGWMQYRKTILDECIRHNN